MKWMHILKKTLTLLKPLPPLFKRIKLYSTNQFVLINSRNQAMYQLKYAPIGENRKNLEKQIMLQILDVHWKEHLAEMDHLRQSIGLRSFMHRKIQRMNTNERAYSMFENMLDEINSETIRILFNLTIASKEELEKLEQA